jgi:hypothetical protein
MSPIHQRKNCRRILSQIGEVAFVPNLPLRYPEVKKKLGNRMVLPARIGGPVMNRYEKALVVLMRAAGVMLLIAVIPAVMPFAWMKDIHRLLGMGELPEGPIMGYLTRSLSAMYAMHGALVFFISLDVRRYRPVVKCLAVLGIIFGLGMLVLDFVVGMPFQWTMHEGPFIVIMGFVMLWLAGYVDGNQGRNTI